MSDKQLQGLTIPLSETLQSLRKELQEAQLEAKGETVMFQMDKVEIELKVLISTKTSGEAGVAFWVVKGGAGFENSGETTHTIKLTLTPVDEANGRLLVSSKKEKGSIKD